MPLLPDDCFATRAGVGSLVADGRAGIGVSGVLDIAGGEAAEVGVLGTLDAMDVGATEGSAGVAVASWAGAG